MVYIVRNYDTLSHYGVKGMRWGVRHDKPSSGKKRKKNYTEKNDTKKKKTIRSFIKDHPYLTIGATIAVSVLAIKGGIKLSQLYKQGYFTDRYKPTDILKILPSYEEKNMEVVNNPPNLLKSAMDKLSDGRGVLSMNLSEAQSFNKSVKDGWFTNCVHCTNAAILRRKGYDVIANNAPGGGHPTEDVLKWWKGAKIEEFTFKPGVLSSADKSEIYATMERTLRSYGKRSYGEMHVFNSLTGHSVEYFVTENGIKINDYQVKQTYDSIKDFFEKSDFTWYADYTKFIRLDRCTPNLEQMLKDHIIKPRVLKNQFFK